MGRMLRQIGDYLRVGAPDWAVRRRIAVLICLWSMGMMSFVIVAALSNPNAPLVITTLGTLITLVVNGYIIAAVADDALKRRDAQVARTAGNAPPPTQGG